LKTFSMFSSLAAICWYDIKSSGSPKKPNFCGSTNEEIGEWLRGEWVKESRPAEYGTWSINGDGKAACACSGLNIFAFELRLSKLKKLKAKQLIRGNQLGARLNAHKDSNEAREYALQQ
jgi:hypothetical protein